MRCRELLRETANAHEMVIHAGSVNRDHVHMLLSILPSLSVSRAVQYLKGRSRNKHDVPTDSGDYRPGYKCPTSQHGHQTSQ